MNNEKDEIIKISYKLGRIFRVIFAIILNVIFILIFIKLNGLRNKLIFAPFMIIGLLHLLFLVAKKPKTEAFLKKMLYLIFYLFLFGFLIFFDYISIKEGQYFLFFLSLFFWLVGILKVYQSFFKKKNSNHLQ